MTLSGFFIIDKHPDISSAQVLRVLKKKFNLKKLGHIGTLDPLATGVLPVAVGEATKLIPYLQDEPKIYEAKAILGTCTDTFDSTGKVIQENKLAQPSLAQVIQCLQSFLGKQSQQVPIFSAVKKAGKPLYAYARQGEIVEPPFKQVTIFEIQFIAYQYPEIIFKVTCSKGTYIRSLIHDLGIKLKTFAHMTALRRIQSGDFKLEHAIDLEKVILQNLQAPLSYLQHLTSINLNNQNQVLAIRQGKLIELNQQNNNLPFIILFEDKVIALAQWGDAHQMRYLRVFNPY